MLKPDPLPRCYECGRRLYPRLPGAPETPDDMFMLGAVPSCRRHAVIHDAAELWEPEP